jgi:hypothetical protein
MDNVKEALISSLAVHVRDAIDNDFVDEIISLMKKQEPLGEPFASVLNENLSELYEN